MSDTVEQIKSRLDVVDIISGYLKVQKAGVNYKARCPFHNEKTPSFYLSPERQSWHCFGCNKGGDMFSFIQEIEGIEFVEALRILAARAGVALPERRQHETGDRSERQALLAAAELTAKFFQKQLWHSTSGAKALTYLRERGMTDETITAWELGWAPNDWRALTGFLQDQGHEQKHIVGAGVAAEKNGRCYDRFRSRIMFPIRDANGQTVGFTGRVFGAEVAVDLPAGRQVAEPVAKYINTPQTAMYDKSRILFGLDKAKMAMRQHDACLLVEGNVDAIMSSQAGASHVVATSGTALTAHQLRMLGRYSTNLDFCFDADQAGKAATRRGIGLALAQNFSVRILAIRDKECKDPADYVKKYGTGWNDIVASAKPALQYYYDEAMAGYDPASVASKKSVVASLGPLIKRLASKVEQSHWVSQLASVLRTDAASVSADIASVRDDIAVYDPHRLDDEENVAPVLTQEPLDPQNIELLALLVRYPGLAAQVAQDADVVDPRIAAIIKEPALLSATAESPYKHLVDAAYMRADEWWGNYADDQLQAPLTTLLARLRERDLRVRRAQLGHEIQLAESAKDQPRLRELMATFQEYTVELNRLQNIQSSNILS